MSMIPVAAVVGEVQAIAHRAANGGADRVRDSLIVANEDTATNISTGTRAERLERAAALIALVAIEDFGSP